MKLLRDGSNRWPGMQGDTSIYFGLKCLEFGSRAARIKDSRGPPGVWPRVRGTRCHIIRTWLRGARVSWRRHGSQARARAYIGKRIQAGDSGARLQAITSAELKTDSWDVGLANGVPARSPAGQYLPVLFLRDGDLAVVSPIQNKEMNHYGFSFWRFKGQPSR